MRIQYRHPRLYDFLISLIYPKELLDAFSAEVGKGQTIFEVAAGYGRMAKYIDPSNAYYGIDLNEIFVRYGQKQGIKVEIGNIFFEQAYRQSDVFVVVDVVHHFTKEKLKELFQLIFRNAKKKVVIIEPAFVDLGNRYGMFGRLVDWFFKKMDYDGFNRIGRWFTDQEYADLFEARFGSEQGNRFSLHRQKVSNHHVVVFTRN